MTDPNRTGLSVVSMSSVARFPHLGSGGQGVINVAPCTGHGPAEPVDGPRASA